MHGGNVVRRWVRIALAVAVVAVGLVYTGATATPAAAANAVLVVNNTGDAGDADGADGQCRTSTGVCTLRAAIEQANYNPGSDTIHFNIGGTGTRTISVSSGLWLNDLSGGTTIDGYTQPGASVNTAAAGSNADIRIDVRAATTLRPLLLITSAENVVRGLALRGPGERIEMRGEDADGNQVIGNFIGTNPSGTYESTGDGISLNLGPDQNAIGGPAPADRNIISGNTGVAVRLNHGETSQNVVENNVIGLRPDLSNRLAQHAGVDVQWWTWGNLITGNLISGNNYGGVDLSHSATGNAVIGNYIGTLGDGNSRATYSFNGTGLLVKDDAKGNYIADNVIGNSNYDGIWHKHNYSGANTFVDNRVGVGVNGGDIGNGEFGLFLTGHDDLYHGTIFAYNDDGGVYITNDSVVDAHTNHPQEKTIGNIIRQSTFHSNAALPEIDIEARGAHVNDPGDADDGAHTRLNPPTVTGVKPGELYGTVCAGCTVEVYQSGQILSDGAINPTSTGTGTGAAWIGRSVADGSGRFSLAEAAMTAGKDLYVLAIDAAGNTSETRGPTRVPSGSSGTIVGNPAANLGPQTAPAAPPRPPAYVRDVFQCTFADGVLSWEDDGAAEYYVWAVTAGVETYLGPVNGTSVAAPPADGYRVEHWAAGYAQETECQGNGAPGEFSCAFVDGTLTWTDVGASEYYIFATTGGAESYVGPASGNSATVADADSYRVEHWLLGAATNATCDGDGVVVVTFSCSHTAGTLTWDDAGASEYYVFATTDGVETYLGGHSSTSLSVPGADSYRVEHWVTGSATNATCLGDGVGNSAFACSVADGVLSWDDAGASEYYVFAVNNGVESYLGGHSTTSLTVPAADGYRVEHWSAGSATNAECDGAGAPAAFACSVTDGVLSWDDAGAAEYYVFSTTDGVESYLGPQAGTSLTVAPADSYRVEHWLTGSVTNAVCNG